MKEKNDLAFDGMAGDGVNRHANKYAGNASKQRARENYGVGPRTGNQSDSSIQVGPSVTKDPHKLTIHNSKGGKINGGATAKSPSNPDKIYIG